MVYAAQPREGTETAKRTRAIASASSLVYAAQPREGTETGEQPQLRVQKAQERFMQLNPARGRKLVRDVSAATIASRFMQLNPARGRKLSISCRRRGTPPGGLCSSTPRGDGNALSIRGHGTISCVRFMQLNPARGRKLPMDVSASSSPLPLGLCSSTPRGDGNS